MDDLLSDRFQARQLIGRGASADVYRAHDALLDRPVALKVFRPGHDELALRRFMEETRTLAGLSHPGLVTVFSCGVDADQPYLVMRLVEGETLQSLVLSGPLSPDRTAELGARLGDALDYIHRKRIVHRDVKPSNILLDADETPVLGDFGIAITADGARLTRTNEIIGTPAYLAPEQVLGEEVGPAADIYALGLTLLECLTGTMEYQAGGEVATAIARLHRAPRLPDELPARLAALLRAMTATDPRDRPTAAQCATELRTPHEQLVTGAVPIVAHQSARPRMTRPIVAAAGAVGALVLGLVLLHANAPTTAQPPVTQAADNQTVVTQSTIPGTTPIPTPKQGTRATTTDAPAVVAVVHPATHVPDPGGPGQGPQGGPPHPNANHSAKSGDDHPGDHGQKGP